jgi:2,5-diketo-D-gluconate reductase B
LKDSCTRLRTDGRDLDAWLVQQEKVAAIPKAASEDHLGSNFYIFDFELSDEEMKRIFALRR